MRLKFVTIGQNLKWPRGRLSLARKKKHRREFMTLALARVIIGNTPSNPSCFSYKNKEPMAAAIER